MSKAEGALGGGQGHKGHGAAIEGRGAVKFQESDHGQGSGQDPAALGRGRHKPDALPEAHTLNLSKSGFEQKAVGVIQQTAFP